MINNIIFAKLGTYNKLIFNVALRNDWNETEQCIREYKDAGYVQLFSTNSHAITHLFINQRR